MHKPKVLIDQYYGDCGLYVEVCCQVVEIVDAHYDDETDTTLVQYASPSLRDVLIGPHRGCYGGGRPPFKSQRKKVLAAAISYIGYYGGETSKIWRGYVLPKWFPQAKEAAC